MNRILLVEDNVFSSGFFKTVLEHEGYQVVVSQSAEDALKQVSASNYQLVVVDINLPGMRGDQFIRNLHKSESHLPIIVISGSGDYDSSELQQLGVRKILLKPVTNEELVQAVYPLVPHEPSR